MRNDVVWHAKIASTDRCNVHSHKHFDATMRASNVLDAAFATVIPPVRLSVRLSH